MEHIRPLAEKYGLLPREGVILCALSGGGDSVALLHYLKTNGFQVAAAHFDHHLRENSGKDAQFARNFCRELGVPFYLGEGDVEALGGNREDAARRLRYRFLWETAKKLGAVRLATAHTASDNLETMLMRLVRGTGLRGLSGIQPRRGELVRPMLHTTRRGVEEYLATNGLAYVEDESNSDTRYTRNFLRHRVIPLLEELNPKLAEGSSRTADALRDDEEYLMDRVRAYLAEAGEEAEPAGLPPALCYRVGRELAARPVQTTELPAFQRVTVGETVETPLWRLVTRRVAAVPDVPPKPGEFYLRGEAGIEGLALRPRREGDRLHPPFRTGKTVKKWMNELKIPPRYRAATPVLLAGGRIAAVAGIGPQAALLARPGEEGIFTQWEKIEEEREDDHG